LHQFGIQPFAVLDGGRQGLALNKIVQRPLYPGLVLLGNTLELQIGLKLRLGEFAAINGGQFLGIATAGQYSYRTDACGQPLRVLHVGSYLLLLLLTLANRRARLCVETPNLARIISVSLYHYCSLPHARYMDVRMVTTDIL